MNDRYARHSLIDWFSQERIAALKVAVIGAGAIGNELLKNFALLGVGEIHIYDFDRIEEHNLTRSVLFRPTDIGAEKSVVAASRAMELDSNTRCIPHCGDFWDMMTIDEISAIDTVFACVDNFEARIRANTLCFLAGTDFVNIALDSRYGSVEYFSFYRGLHGACYECGMPDTVYSRIAERYSCGHLRKVSFVEKKIPTTTITASVAAALGASMGLRLGDQPIEFPAASRVMMDTIAGTATRSELSKRLDCPCCGRMPTKFKLLQCLPIVGELLTNLLPDVLVEFSEPILVGYKDRKSGNSALIFERAANYDDGFPSTLSDDPSCIDMEIRDRFMVSELADRLIGRTIPAKFATVQIGDCALVFEFKGDVR